MHGHVKRRKHVWLSRKGWRVVLIWAAFGDEKIPCVCFGAPVASLDYIASTEIFFPHTIESSRNLVLEDKRDAMGG